MKDGKEGEEGIMGGGGGGEGVHGRGEFVINCGDIAEVDR